MSPTLNPDRISDLQVLMSEEANLWLSKKVEILKQKVKRLNKDLTILYDPGTFKQTADNVSAQNDLQMTLAELSLKERHLKQAIVVHKGDKIGKIKLGEIIHVQYLQSKNITSFVLGTFYDAQLSLETKQKPQIIYFDSPLVQMATEKGLNNPFIINGQKVQVVGNI